MHWIALQVPHEDVAAWGWHCLRFTPRVTRLEEAWLLEVSASERLFGGREALLHQLLSPEALPEGLVQPAQPGEPGRPARLASPASPAAAAAPAATAADVSASSAAASASASVPTAPAFHVPVSASLEQPPALYAVPWSEGPSCLVALALLRLKVAGAAPPPRVPHDLPLPLLSAAAPHAPLLERTGCRSWGALRALPRGPVARRFGAALLEALDVAWGERPARHAWLQLPEVFDLRLELPALASSAPELMWTAQRLLAQLQLWLRARHRGVLGLELEWTLDLKRLDGVALPPHERLVVRTAEAAQEMAHLRRLVGEQLARARLAAPANHLRLRTLETAPWSDASRSFLPEDNVTGERLHQLVERLSARLGEDRVLVPLPRADWRPERMQCWEPAVRHLPALLAPGKAAGRARVASRLRVGEARGGERTAGKAGLPASLPGSGSPAQDGAKDETACPRSLYPPWLLPQPLRLEVRGERPWYEGPLRLLTQRQRIETGWWEEGGAVVRDYCIARSERAGLLWIYCEHGAPGVAPRWYLQGLYA
ncbi:DNA polymerase Y family protein [Ramlibacter sp. AN1015]|uniref:DNA polymerase Y family protein n=1 Tax=Ramlibacter sp. AN1015 TaxID=3133428 RepID=UPI0030BB77D4